MPDFNRLWPRYWNQNKPTSLAWDAALNLALDECGITSVSLHEAVIGPFTVWIANWPYSFGYNRADPFEQPPLVKTRLKLRRAINDHQRDCYMAKLHPQLTRLLRE